MADYPSDDELALALVGLWSAAERVDRLLELQRGGHAVGPDGPLADALLGVLLMRRTLHGILEALALSRREPASMQDSATEDASVRTERWLR
jgi:hypothetical protein